MPSPSDSHRRFERRVDDYAASRPDYPTALVRQLVQRWLLASGDWVADVGSGTGIFSRRLLDLGVRVAGVEPGEEMRCKAETLLADYAGFTSINGTAAATGLPENSVAAIFCAQAFHWFNEDSTLLEWRRILRPGGPVVLIWNYADENCPFVADYLTMVRAYGGSEAQETIAAAWNAQFDNVLFRHTASETTSSPFRQRLEFDGLLRRVLSTSYLPKKTHPSFAGLAADLRTIFDRHQSAGAVDFAYRTVAVHGTLA